MSKVSFLFFDGKRINLDLLNKPKNTLKTILTKVESTAQSFWGEGEREGGGQCEGEEEGEGQGGGRGREDGRGEGGDRVGRLRGGAGVGEGEGALFLLPWGGEGGGEGSGGGGERHQKFLFFFLLFSSFFLSFLFSLSPSSTVPLSPPPYLTTSVTKNTT